MTGHWRAGPDAGTGAGAGARGGQDGACPRYAAGSSFSIAAGTPRGLSFWTSAALLFTPSLYIADFSKVETRDVERPRRFLTPDARCLKTDRSVASVS